MLNKITHYIQNGADRGRPHLAPGDYAGGCMVKQKSCLRNRSQPLSERNSRCIHRELNGRAGERMFTIN